MRVIAVPRMPCSQHIYACPMTSQKCEQRLNLTTVKLPPTSHSTGLHRSITRRPSRAPQWPQRRLEVVTTLPYFRRTAVARRRLNTAAPQLAAIVTDRGVVGISSTSAPSTRCPSVLPSNRAVRPTATQPDDRPTPLDSIRMLTA